MTDRQNITVHEGNERLSREGDKAKPAKRTTTERNPKPPEHGKIIADQDDDSGAEKRHRAGR